MTAGVYRITNTVTGDFYIGCSNNIEKRFHNHITALSTGKHYKAKMLEHWAKYGSNAFVLDVLVITENKSEMLSMEYRLSKKMQPTYNKLTYFQMTS